MLDWQAARARVIEDVRALAAGSARAVVSVSLADAAGRVLAEALLADRDQPPFDRSTRDGFAVRASDVAVPPTSLRVLGEVAAGGAFVGEVRPGTCVAIMTGAPMPAGADAVVMVEHTRRQGDDVQVERAVGRGENVVPRGDELAEGAVALAAGARLTPAAVALAASVGCADPRVFARVRVAILPTGDELVDVRDKPGPSQIRNSNAFSLAAQVERGGAEALMRVPARDDMADTRRKIEAALEAADVLVLSGGVSMGAHDVVEDVLRDLGATFAFDAVGIRPGKPTVFGQVRGKPFFGLPGNPLSTLVTFELFARPALEVLAGGEATPPRFVQATLAAPLAQKPTPLTVFLPVQLEGSGAALSVLPLPWRGSGDLATAARSDAWLVLPPQTGPLAAGAPVAVWMIASA